MKPNTFESYNQANGRGLTNAKHASVLRMIQANGIEDPIRHQRNQALLKATHLPVPDFITPFVRSLSNSLTGIQMDQDDEYLDLSLVQSTFLQMQADLAIIILEREYDHRHLLRSDLQYGSGIDTIYVHLDTIQPILRRDIAVIDGEVVFVDPDDQQIYPLPEDKLFVDNTTLTATLIYNAQYVLSLGLAYLYDLKGLKCN